VQADRRARRELLVLARKYYDELDINFPNVRNFFLVFLLLLVIFCDLSIHFFSSFPCLTDGL